MAALLKRFIPPEAELVVATSLGPGLHGLPRPDPRGPAPSISTRSCVSRRSLNRSLVPERAERAFIASLHLAQAAGGLGTLLGLDRAFGHAPLAGLRRYAHHLTHAAYACWGSPFAEAACLVVDGMGETGASALYAYRDGRVTEVKRHRGRESIGFFFGLVTDLAGFDQSKGEEWKIMGLAPYGSRDPELLALLRRLYRIEGRRLIFADAATIREAAAGDRPTPSARCRGERLGGPVPLRAGRVRGDDGRAPRRSRGCRDLGQPRAVRRLRPQLLLQRQDPGAQPVRRAACPVGARRRRQRDRGGLARLSGGSSGLAPGARIA